MAYGRSRQLDIAFFRHTVRDTVPRPSKPLRVADALLARRSLRPAIASAAVPAAAAAWPFSWNDSGEEAQLSTGFPRQAVSALAVAADQPPRQTVLPVIFLYSLEEMLFKRRR